MRYRNWPRAVLFTLTLIAPVVAAQPRDRLATSIDSRNTVTLHSTRNPRIEGLADEGPVEDTTRITGLSFRFKPSAEQATALEQLLEDQQNPASPLYHVWLTPEEFGERFGLSQNDLLKVTDWLSSEGFQVDDVARSRTYVTFSGTAGQVRNTFRTELRRYRKNGEMHFANAADLVVPADLEPLIYTLRGTDDFRMKRDARLKRMITLSGGRHMVGPGDLATIYNINPIYQKGIDGSGQKIVVTGQSAFNMSDIQAFRSMFGLPQNDPQMVAVPGYPVPGINDDVSEAVMDVDYAGAMAPNATILFVYSKMVIDAVQYTVDRNLAPIISHSYGGCENRLVPHPSAVQWLRSLAQQANAQGITWVASSGDTGPAACETQLKDFAGLSGIVVNWPASIPEVTGVGGTEFVEGTGNYWSNTNSATKASALSYIPEIAWNDTENGAGLATTGGGASILFGKPAWQAGPGVPNVNARHVPDIAFAAAWDHDPYLMVLWTVNSGQ